MTEPIRSDYKISDSLWAEQGQIFLTGTQALVRLLPMQRELDRRLGWNTKGFISGYRGSPLGMVDQEVWKAQPRLTECGIDFLPAINEELGATAVLGTQRVEADPERTADGVFAMWYGKGPGVDRAGDALKHGNAYGSSPHGGVLVVAGDDHGCVSSSMPHQSDQTMRAWSMPVVAPACVAEYLEFGLFGWALSRFSGTWVGMTAISEVVESGATVDLDLINRRVGSWSDADTVRQQSGLKPHADGLHIRWPDLPSLKIESRLPAKLAAVAAFARINRIDRNIVAPKAPQVGIVTAGKAHFDFLEVLRRLDISLDDLALAGVAVYKVGLSFPIEQHGMRDFCQGLGEVLVIEEKGSFVEQQMQEMLYNDAVRPRIVGKFDRDGQALVSALGELRPSRLIELVAGWLADVNPSLDQRHAVIDFVVPELLSNIADAVKRLPYFCAGCPHNTSTKVPEGSKAQAGIGCHFMASWMDRDTEGLIQMGGEGVDWVSHSRFTKVPHIFQNLGDGTYYHSGYLAIRQAVAAKATMTYKILFNDAVAMTGGQPVDGVISVDGIARQVEAEGVKKVVVVSDDIDKYQPIAHRFPGGTEFLAREALDEVQRRLRDLQGVTVLIYEQTCAAEKRRRRKRGEAIDPAKRLFINQSVCEGCGDCGVQSNCVAVLPDETELGRKRKISQSSCNKDYSCAKGFCPSFVSVEGGQLKKRSGLLASGRAVFDQLVSKLPLPAEHQWIAPYDLLITGVGGTGVVTIGAIVAMAANLEGKSASVLDFMGFAQKGGSVLSFVRLADRPERLNQVRIDAQQADAVLACDVVVAASPDALSTIRRGRTRIIANTHSVPVADSLRQPDADLHMEALLDKLTFAAGDGLRLELDGQQLAELFFGDSIFSNMICLGFAWQAGVIPLSLDALERAIVLNGVAMEMNRLAFHLGRVVQGVPDARDQLAAPRAAPANQTLEGLIASNAERLTAYQNAAYAERYRAFVEHLRDQESQVHGDAGFPFTTAAARSLQKLMMYKDEYEVARLYTDGSFQRALNQQFDGGFKLRFHMAPPAFAKPKNGAPPLKISLGPWLFPVLQVLARLRALRGTWLDPFGRTEERKLERRLIEDFIKRCEELMPQITAENIAVASEIARVPMRIRGYGHVKLASLAIARASEAELLSRFNPERYSRPPRTIMTEQFRGIAVTSA
jgi:indolepyruvate ferredoxin oxidoreductase